MVEVVNSPKRNLINLPLIEDTLPFASEITTYVDPTELFLNKLGTHLGNDIAAYKEFLRDIEVLLDRGARVNEPHRSNRLVDGDQRFLCPPNGQNTALDLYQKLEAQYDTISYEFFGGEEGASWDELANTARMKFCTDMVNLLKGKGGMTAEQLADAQKIAS